uniref:Uncharacterized protein n=1 Tax=Cacopsylla melanoneura TaxID=428564 RepID=A0A8D8YKN9_9HEMI
MPRPHSAQVVSLMTITLSQKRDCVRSDPISSTGSLTAVVMIIGVTTRRIFTVRLHRYTRTLTFSCLSSGSGLTIRGCPVMVISSSVTPLNILPTPSRSPIRIGPRRMTRPLLESSTASVGLDLCVLRMLIREPPGCISG